LAELASKGIVDSLSLAIATTDNPEQFETMDLVDVKSPFKKDKRPQFSLTKSVDRHHFNDEFVIRLMSIILNNIAKTITRGISIG